MNLLRVMRLAHLKWFTEWFTATHGPYTAATADPDKKDLWRSEYKRTWEPLKRAVQEIEEYSECRALVDGSE